MSEPIGMNPGVPEEEKRPKYVSPKDGGNKSQIVTPSGKVINESFFQNETPQRILNENQIYFLPTLRPGVKDTYRPASGRGYWEDPRRIERYHNFLRTAPPNWQKPEWLDDQAVEAAHKYFTETQGSDWTNWKYLAEEDPATGYLRNLAMPPIEAMFPNEVDDVRQQAQINTWDDLYPFQQTFETFFVPQPLAADDSERPWLSKVFANIIRSGMQGAAGMAIGGLLAKGAAIAGITGASAAGIAALPVVLGATFALGSLYQLSTGKKVPVIGDMLEWMGVAGKPAQWTEQAIGVAEQAVDNDLESIMDELPAAWQAADANWETNVRNFLMDWWTQGAAAVGAEGATPEMVAGPGEIYQWELGLVEPQKLPEGYVMGVDALNDMREQIIAGADPIAVVEDYKQKFGQHGIINDFVLQNIADPLNYMPSMTQSAMRGIGKLTDNPKMLASFGAVTPSNLIVDGLPMPLNMLAPMVSGGRLQGSAGLMDGLLKYQSFVRTGVFPGMNGPEDFIPPKDYTNADKAIAGLTEEGLPKEFIPTKTIEEGPAKGLRNWFNKVINLTPASKAEIVSADMIGHLYSLANYAGDDVGLFIKMMQTAEQVDVNTTAEIFEKIVNPAGMSGNLLEPQNFVRPIGAAMAQVFKGQEISKLIDDLYTNKWMMPEDARLMLLKSAELLGIKPGELLEQIYQKGMDVGPSIVKAAAEQNVKIRGDITTDTLKKALEIFTGDDPLPIHPDQFKQQTLAIITDKIYKHMAARFGLEQDSKFQRFMGIMKDMQSLLVLGFNPAYMVNNLINNVVTRVNDGIFGYMTRPQVNKYLERFEILPTRMDMGLSNSSLAKRAFGIQSDGRVTGVRDVIKQENDLVSAAQKAVKGISEKVGVFSRLSAIIEKSESKQAYMSALMHMQSSLWQRGMAIRPLPERVSQALGKDVTARLNEIVEKSLNAKELDQNAYGKGKLTATEIINKVAESFVLNNTDATAYKQMLVEVFASHGILQELDGLLAKAETPADIDNAFITVRDSIQTKIRDMRAEELINNLAAKKVLIESEGITAAISEMIDTDIDFGMTWINSLDAMSNLFARKPNMDSAEFTRQYKIARQQANWKFGEVSEWQLSTMEAMMDVMGFAKDNPSVKMILDNYKETTNGWQKAHQTKDQKYEDFIKKVREEKLSDESYKIAKAQIDQEVQDMMLSMYELELSNLRKTNEAFISLSKNKELARQWRDGTYKVRSQMIDDMIALRKDLKDNPPKTIMEENQRWSKFLYDKYYPQIVALKQIESAYQKMVIEKAVTTETDIAKQIQQRIVEGPLDDSIPAVLRTKIQQEAEAMLSELSSGTGGKRIPIMEYDPLSKLQRVDHMEAMSTTNVGWYRRLYDENSGANRDTLTNALKYLVEGSNKTNQYTKKVKELIVDRLRGWEPRGYDMGQDKVPDEFYVPDIESAYLMGLKDVAAAELHKVMNGEEPDVDSYFTDPALEAEILDYWSNDFVPKNTIREMFTTAMGDRLSDPDVDFVMEMWDLKAEQWARDTGNHPREWWKKYFREIKYTDDPVEYMRALHETAHLPEEWHFSKLLTTIEGMPNKMPADQMMGWLTGKVKQEEMSDTGFAEWVKQQTGTITKADALDYLAENKIRVEETIRGKPSKDSAIKELRKALAKSVEIGSHPEVTLLLNRALHQLEDKVFVPTSFERGIGNLLNSVRQPTPGHPLPAGDDRHYAQFTDLDEAKRLVDMGVAYKDTRYDNSSLLTEGDYTDYRELLLTLPVKPIERLSVAKTSKGTYDIPDGSGGWLEFKTEQEAIDHYNKIAPTKYHKDAYQSSHWDEPNVLAHIRFNDRISADGLEGGWKTSPPKKVLYIEEIQSDWHQAGRKMGYGNKDGVPDAPFKSSWNMLSMKRMIRWAVENGYDRIAWTPGDIQAERYNLANYVDELRYNKTTNQLQGIKDGNAMFDETVPPDKLKDYVGEDPTARIISDPNDQVTLVGDDLKVGGEGMRGFYDRIMIHDTNKLIKKYGAQVGETRFYNEGDYFNVFDPDGDKINSFHSKADAEAEAKRLTEIYHEGLIKIGSTVEDSDVYYAESVGEGNLAVHSFDITDDMRKMVQEGIPLYQRDLDIFSIANKYGIATATADGKPLNAQLLNTINKYSETKFKTLEEVTPEAAIKALEARRIEKGEPAVEKPAYKAAVSFDKDGAAIMRLSQAADLKSVVHETGHMFRRQLDGDDLEAIAKWTGIESAEEYARLEQKFDNGTIAEDELIRYETAEEKFADGFTKYMANPSTSLPAKIKLVFAKFAQWLQMLRKTLKIKHDMDLEATVEVNGKQVLIRDVMDRMFVKIEGENPLGRTPQPQPQSKPLSEIMDMYGYPLLDTMKDQYKRGYENYKPLNVDGDIPAEYRADVVKWLNQSKNDMSSMKYASMKYAEAKRDQALLNYSRRTGFDDLISVPFPYIFWYTKSMINWAMRSIDRPKLYATYARYRAMQEKMEREGIPQRLKGKMRMNAPYLPDWMGGGLWQDPMKQLFPFAQFDDTDQRATHMANTLKHETYNVLNEMADDGKITQEQADSARESMGGELWDMAQAEAASRVGTFTPQSLASMMASPAMYWDIPLKLMTGFEEQIQPTPMLRTTQAVETLTQDTPFAGIGQLVGKIGDMTEGALRRKIMTPATAMFGEYGDYYVDRQLSNMVADGELGIKEAKIAMVEREGPVYAAAVNRVRQEVAMRVPGSAAVMAMKNGASIPQFAAAVFHSLNPSGLLPTGELEYLNLKDEYALAWKAYNMGDKKPLNQFFEDHPVFEARIAIKDDPEERLQNFLVSEIWDRYMTLPIADRQLVTNQLGQQFQDAFLSERVYDAIPVEQLAKWAHMMGAMIPQVDEIPQDINQMPMAELWSADSSNAYQMFEETRDQQFPMIRAIESRYFDVPRNKQQSYLKEHPELLEYWEWKDEYRAQYPEIEPVMAYRSAQYAEENASIKNGMLQSMPTELTMQLQAYSMTGRNMGPGAWESLRYAWEQAGKPYGSLKKWVDEELVYMVR